MRENRGKTGKLWSKRSQLGDQESPQYKQVHRERKKIKKKKKMTREMSRRTSGRLTEYEEEPRQNGGRSERREREVRDKRRRFEGNPILPKEY